MSKLTLGSLFDGSGGFPLAAELSGIKSVWASEVEPFPIAVTRKNFPNMKQLGDVRKIDGAKIEPVDIITFGSPCFPKGTLVLTKKGYVPIEKISTEDYVLTHTGNWHRVLQTGSKEANTVLLHGCHQGLECTPNHPIYSAELISKKAIEGTNTYFVNEPTAEHTWLAANDMLGKLWAVPKCIKEIVAMPRDFSFDEMHEFGFSITEDSHLESWIYTMSTDLQHALLKGIIDKVGSYEAESTFQLVFKSHHLAESTRLLAEILNYSTTVSYYDNLYHLLIARIRPETRCDDNLHSWYLVNDIEKLAYTKTVYNLEVETDNSYIANNIVVHNCQDLSVSGKRAGLEGKQSSLFLEAIRIVKEMREATSNTKPRYIVWENVCFIKDTLITTPNSYVPIQNIHIGDMVRTHKGTFEQVQGVQCTKNVPTYTLSTLSNTVTATGEHPFLVRKKDSKPVWKELSKISENEYISYTLNDSNLAHISDLLNNILTKHTSANSTDYFISENRLWEKVVSVKHASIQTVYNITVEREHTYEANGITVHNCGAFSSHNGEDFRTVLEEIAKVKDPEVSIPKSEKWEQSGCIMADNYSIGWRVLDAQYWGVPQRRSRVFVVADFAGTGGEEILFKSEGLSGYSAEGFKQKQEIAKQYGRDSSKTG